MPDPGARYRRTIRLPYFDYAASAPYFVTLVTHERAPLFGCIEDDVMHLSRVGEIVRDEWSRSPEIRPELELDEFVVMPNHLHGIVIIAKGSAAYEEAASTPAGAHRRAPLQRAPRSLGSFISGYKATTTRRARMRGLVVDQSVFQRNYFERVIRHQRELERIRVYIADNPRRWSEDPENARSS